MSAPQVVSVVGFKDVGKTQVVEALVRELAGRGLRVGTLKHTSQGHSLDTPGKDTWRHRMAGSVESAILSSDEAAFFLSQPVNVVQAVEKMDPLDLVILEGFKSLDTVSRVLIPRDASEFKALANGLEIAVSGPHVEKLPSLNISAIPLNRIGDLADIILSNAFPLLPGLNCKGCGYESCRELALAIVSGEEDANKCIKHVGAEVRLHVDGRKVATNPFIQKVMRNVVLGVIRTLKGIDDCRRIEIAFDLAGEEHD